MQHQLPRSLVEEQAYGRIGAEQRGGEAEGERLEQLDGIYDLGCRGNGRSRLWMFTRDVWFRGRHWSVDYICPMDGDWDGSIKAVWAVPV
jgi:hypothetical protein